MPLPEDWRMITDLVVERLRREKEQDPDNAELDSEIQTWLAGMQDTLNPQPGRQTEVLESAKGWQRDDYLPTGLTGEMPTTKEDIQTGLRLLQWYVSEDYLRRRTMEPEDARILARWAFTRGVLHVEVVGTERQMQIKDTYTALLKIMETKGEGAGRQIR